MLSYKKCQDIGTNRYPHSKSSSGYLRSRGTLRPCYQTVICMRPVLARLLVHGHTLSKSRSCHYLLEGDWPFLHRHVFKVYCSTRICALRSRGWLRIHGRELMYEGRRSSLNNDRLLFVWDPCFWRIEIRSRVDGRGRGETRQCPCFLQWQVIFSHRLWYRSWFRSGRL
jgi:hypothetical protein